MSTWRLPLHDDVGGVVASASASRRQTCAQRAATFGYSAIFSTRAIWAIEDVAMVVAKAQVKSARVQRR